MKKTYIAPTVNVYEIKAKSILMTSGNESIQSGDAWSSGEAASREFSFGDEE
jgi:hypothetical protein